MNSFGKRRSRRRRGRGTAVSFGAADKKKISKTVVATSIDVTNKSIFDVDIFIRDFLDREISSIPTIQKDIVKLLLIAEKGINDRDKKTAQEQADILKRRIKDLEGTFRYALYICKTECLLEEYRVLNKKRDISFTTAISQEMWTIIHRQNEIEEQYYNIASEYVEIEGFEKKLNRMCCPHCHGIDIYQTIDYNGMIVCENCGYEMTAFDNAPSYKDSGRCNMSSKYTYTRKGHFIDAIKRFQGKQTTDKKKINNAVSVVKKEIENLGIAFANVSADLIHTILSEKGLSNQYDNANLIFHRVTGKKCPDIEKYYKQLVEDFERLEPVLEEVKDSERTNSLNVNYKLYKLLQRQGYDCKKTDFHILKTKAKEEEHDEVMNKAFERLGWKWIPTM